MSNIYLFAQFPFWRLHQIRKPISKVQYYKNLENKSFKLDFFSKICRTVTGQNTVTMEMGNLIGGKRNIPSNCFTCCSTDAGANRPCNDHMCPASFGKVMHCYTLMIHWFFISGLKVVHQSLRLTYPSWLMETTLDVSFNIIMRLIWTKVGNF